MTQLPEAEVVRKSLEKEVVGRRVKTVDVKAASTVGRHRNRPDFTRAVEGRKVMAVTRRGTSLIIGFDDDTVLVIILGPEGVLTRQPATAPAGPQTQLVLTFTTGGALHLADPAGHAEAFVTSAAELAAVPELEQGGIDPLTDIFTWHAFGRYLTARNRPLKALLVDETFVLGLGALYSDEVLWMAGLAGGRTSKSLSSQEVRRLYRALFEVLHEAVKQGGTSHDDDGGHTDLEGHPGSYGTQLNVYDREGEPCPRCRRPIERGTVAEHPIHYCASCQT